jgi:carboxypeptidase Q
MKQLVRSQLQFAVARWFLARGFLALGALGFAACAASSKHEAAPLPEGPPTLVIAESAQSTAAPAALPQTDDRVAQPASFTVPPGHTGATQAVVSRVLELARTDNQVQTHLRELTLGIGPRLTSSHNLERAQQWALRQFSSWGLQARLEPWGEFPVGFDRGGWSGGIVAPEKVELVFNTPAWSAGTNGPKRGRALFYPATVEALAEVKDQLPGAWIVTPQWERDQRPKKEVTDAVDAALKEAGIAGRVRRARGELLITDGNYKIEWAKLPTEVRIQLRADQFDDLVKRMQADANVELEFDVDNRFYEGPVKQYNVVADLVGTELPDEVVIVGGHLDSWDGAQGTVDNGTGSATTLEAARLLAAAGARPKRTIRFILWSGEEQGLFGSRGYVRDHEQELGKISAVLIHDGGTNYVSGITCTPEMEADLKLACAPIIGLDPEMPFEVLVAEGIRNSGDSDHAPFIGAGVPGFFWEQEGRSDYNHMHHTQYDTFDSAVPEYQQHSSAVIATVAYGIANLERLLDRTNMEPIAPRRMGVQLDGLTVTEVMDNGKGLEAGWKAGDKILAVEGLEVKSRGDLARELQKGGPRKTVKIQRGEETLDTVLDYTGSKEELKREERRKAREQGAKDKARRFW